jgi:hypothetical protein
MGAQGYDEDYQGFPVVGLQEMFGGLGSCATPDPVRWHGCLGFEKDGHGAPALVALAPALRL